MVLNFYYGWISFKKMIHEHPFIHTLHYTPYVLGIFW